MPRFSVAEHHDLVSGVWRLNTETVQVYVVEVDVELSPTATEPGVRTINVQPFIDEVKKEVEAVVKS